MFFKTTSNSAECPSSEINESISKMCSMVNFEAYFLVWNIAIFNKKMC